MSDATPAHKPSELTPREFAEALDQQIRVVAKQAHVVLEALCALVEAAKVDKIHETLGYPSWTAYLADALDGQWKLERDKRGEVVRYLAEQGMSQRAITKATGVARSTVQRELEQVAQLGQVLGLDGKIYARPEQVAHDGPPDETDDEWLARKLAEPHTIRIPANAAELKARMAEIHDDEQRLYEVMYKRAFEKVAQMPNSATRNAIEFGLHMRVLRRRALRGLEQGLRIEQVAEQMGASVAMVEDYIAAPTSSDIEFVTEIMAGPR